MEAIIRGYAALGERADLVRQYLAKFAAPGKALRHGRHLRLLEETRELLKPGGFRLQGKKAFMTAAALTEALEEVAGRGFETPLTNHNYLKRVALTKQEKLGAAEEQKRETARKHRQSFYEPPREQKATPEERKRVADETRELARDIGVWPEGENHDETSDDREPRAR